MIYIKKPEQKRLSKFKSESEEEVKPSTVRGRQFRARMKAKGLTPTTFYTSVTEKKLISLLTKKLGYDDSSEMLARVLAEKGEQCGFSLDLINKELRRPGGKGCAL